MASGRMAGVGGCRWVSAVGRRAVLCMVLLGCLFACGTAEDMLPDAKDVWQSDQTDETDTLPEVVVGNNVIHVDLTDRHLDEGAKLHVAGKSYPLRRHDHLTRHVYRGHNTALQTVHDRDLTHFVEDVELPQDRVALMWVTHTTDERKGHHGLGVVGLHIPKSALNRARTLRRAQLDPSFCGKADSLIIPADSIGDDGDPDDLLTPMDAAKTLLFHHPELVNLDPDVAARVMTHIEGSVGLIELAESISSQGPAYEYDPDYDDGWAILEPILDEEGNRRLKANGEPFYHYIFSDKTKADAEMALKHVLKVAHDDPELEGSTYHTQDGVAAVDASPAPVPIGAMSNRSLYRWVLEHVQTRAGLEAEATGLDNDPATGNRRIQVKLKNHWLRHLSFYVAFEDVDGNRIAIPADMATDDDDKDNHLLFVDHLPPVVTIMAIPLSADWSEFTIRIPDAAQKVVLMAGGLGTGTFEFATVANDGIVLTAIWEYGVPLFFLAAGAGMKDTAWFKSIMEDKELVIAMIAVGGFLLAGENAAEIGFGGSPKKVLSRSATMVGNLILGVACKKLKTYLIEKLTESELEGAIPFVGWAIQVLSIGVTLASLAETTVEVLKSPWIIKNAVTPSMDMQVTIHHDVDDYQFPATATQYRLIATYTDSTHRELPMRSMPGTTVSDPIVEVFSDVPAGGTVEVTAAFYSANGWLAGKGSTGRVKNLITDGSDKLKVSITIQEELVPLSATTQYHHKQKLNYIAGEYKWVAGLPPTKTVTDLSCANVGAHLCDLSNITFSQKTGMFGYAWRAAGPGMTVCDSTTKDLQLHFLQGMSATEHPGAGYKTLGCGMSNPSTIVYELLGPADGTGYNFFLDTRDGKYNLRRIVLDQTTPMTYKARSWGRFTQSFDDVAMREGGYIVGANWKNSKIEILKIPDEPYFDDEAPFARLLAGEGVREGLMRGPKAIAFAADGTLLILESLNRRIQALDVDGNPVLYFNDKTEYFTELTAETEAVEYLDMGVEYLGYIYVLSYINDGRNVGDYRLDIYEPGGAFLTRTTGVAAHKMTVDLWRNVFALNYEAIVGPGGRTEPSVSEWIPSTPVPPPPPPPSAARQMW